MWPCLVRYDVVLRTQTPEIRRAVALYREWREPDDNGDPGPLVERELIELNPPAPPYFKIAVADRRGALTWENDPAAL